MQFREYKITLDIPNLLPYSNEDIIYFDIETTGLSATTSYLYLIGCIYYHEGSYHLKQWLSDSINEEKQLIIYFFDFLCNYKVLVHYNGQAFDLPYLLAKIKRYKLFYTFDSIISIDLYKELLPLKKLLSLPNLKQKTVEEFLLIQREDIFDGGDLIAVYQSYVGRRQYEETLSAKLLYTLLLHNADDLKGLAEIIPILSYKQIIKSPVHFTKVSMASNHCLSFHATSMVSVPKEVQIERILQTGSFEFPITLTLKQSEITIIVSTYQGNAKYFFDNYKEYYYLPLEDIAIHKSVSEYVDKNYREKAKSSNCYIKKEGIFLPQISSKISPSFKLSYKDKYNLFEVTDEFLTDHKLLEDYINEILATLFQK